MKRINDYFDRVYCINLDRRPDKWAVCADEFSRNGIDVERFSAVWGEDLPRHSVLLPGEAGCLRSHQLVLDDVIKNGYDRVLVLEDDVEFVPNVQSRFSDVIDMVPAEWDMLYFGGSHLNKPHQVNRAIARITRTYTTSSYGITSSMASEVLANLNDGTPQVDVLYSQYHPKKQCFTFEPALAWQRAGHSDIHGVHVDYTSFMKPKGI